MQALVQAVGGSSLSPLPALLKLLERCVENQREYDNAFHDYTLSLYQLNPANSLCEAMGGGKERVAPGCLSPGASIRVVGVLNKRGSDE